MSQSFDVRTLFLMATVLATLCALVLFGTRRMGGEIARGSGLFAFGLMAIAIGGALYTWRNVLQLPLLTWTLANILAILGPLFYIDGVCVITRQRRWLWPLTITAVVVVLAVYALGSGGNSQLRTFFTLGTRAIFFAVAVFLLLRVHDPDTRMPRRVLAGIFTFNVLFNGQRAVTSLFGIDIVEVGLMNASTQQVVLAVGLGVSPVLIAFGVISLVLRLATTAATQAALLDNLTGLGNRRALSTTVPAKIDDWRRSVPAFEVAVLMVDLDGLKAANDLHGHGAGDAAIARIAQVARRQFAEGIVLRYGGDELCAVVPVANRAAAGTLAEAFRAEVASAPLTVDAARVPLTVSVGVAFAASAAALDVALATADAALIAAKRGGRNRVQMAA